MKSTPFQLEDITKSPLMKQGIVYTSNSDDCDICVARRIDPLKSLIQKHGSHKKYLLWTQEPRWDTHFTQKVLFEGEKIHIMNVYTGDIWLNNYSYTTPPKLNNSSLLPIIEPNQSDFSRRNHKKVVALLSYRNNPKYWSIIRDGIELDLSYLRTQIALEGYQMGKVDIYGQK